MLSTVPYTQPAPQDWSNIMPVSTPLASQQALVSGQGKFYQPWSTGQGVPPGLLNYQIPGGPAANLTYSGAQPSLFDPVTTNGNGNGNGTDEVQLQDWQKAGWDYSSGSPVYKATGWDTALDWYRGLYGADPDFVNPLVQSKTGDTLTNI